MKIKITVEIIVKNFSSIQEAITGITSFLSGANNNQGNPYTYRISKAEEIDER